MVQTKSGQLSMSGMPDPIYAGVGPGNAAPGQAVMYLGRINGGPSYGSHGVIREVRSRKAVVEIGRVARHQPVDVWHIPYYFLAVPGKAA